MQPTSRAPAAQPSVTVATDKSTYRRGEAIHVTVRNDGSAIVYVETDYSSCSVVGIQRRAAGRWRREGTCPPTVAFLPVAAGDTLTTVLGPAPPPPGIQGPIVGEPARPGVNAQDLRTLPPAPPTSRPDPFASARRASLLLGPAISPAVPVANAPR